MELYIILFWLEIKMRKKSAEVILEVSVNLDPLTVKLAG